MSFFLKTAGAIWPFYFPRDGLLITSTVKLGNSIVGKPLSWIKCPPILKYQSSWLWKNVGPLHGWSAGAKFKQRTLNFGQRKILVI